MAYDIGTARGVIEMEYNGRGIKQAQSDLAGLEKSGKNAGLSAEQIGRGATRAGLAIAAGLGAGVAAAANFEARLSAIKAVSGATAGEMDLISKKALQLGKDTAFSAGESALAMEELIKAGLSVDDVLNGAADATVNLAAAGEIDLPQAATIASNAMNQFNLAAKDMPKVADAIAGAANASAIDVGEFGQSLQQVGAVANLAGVSFDDTATAIALLGNAGIKGSDAGTSLKSMFQRLQPTTKKQSELFKELGLITEDGTNKFYDQQGNLKSLADVSQILQNSMKGMTAQQKQATLATLFGSDAIRAAAILSKEGAAGFEEMATSMGKVTAADVAAERLNNFKGSLEQLKGSLETAGIVIGSVLLPALRKLVDGVTGAFNWFLNLSEGTQRFIVIAAAAVSAILLAVGAIVKMVAIGKVLYDTFIMLRTVMATTWVAALGPIALVIAAIVAIGAALVLLYKKSETARNIMNAVWNGIKAAAQAVANWFMSTVVPFFQQMWQGIQAAAQAFGAWWSGFWADVKAAALNVWSVIGPAVMAAWNLIVTIIRTQAQVVLAVVKAAWGVLEGIFSAAWGVISAVVKAAWEVIKTVVGTAIKVVHDVIRSVLKALQGDWQGAWNYLKSAAQAVWNAIKSLIQTAINLIKSVITSVLNGIKQVWSSVWNGIKSVAQTVWNGIKSVIQAAINAVRAVITSVLNAIKSLWNTTWNAIKTLTSSVWNGIKSVITGAINAVRGIISGAMSAIRGLMTSAWNAIKSATSTAWNAIRNAVTSGINGVLGLVRALPGRIVSALGNLANLLYQAGKDVIQGFIDGLKSMAGAVVGAASGVVSSAVGAVGKVLQLGSPSKLFKQFGQWTMQGMIDGVKGTKEDVVGAFTEVIELLRKKNKDELANILVDTRNDLVRLGKEWDQWQSSMEKAQERLKSVREEYRNLKESVSGAILGGFDPASVKGQEVGTFNAEGEIENVQQLPVTYRDIENAALGARDKAEAFLQVVKQLNAAGLNSTALQQIINKGPEEGLAAARALLEEGKAGVQNINLIHGALWTYSQRIGKVAAKSMFDSSIKSAQGVVNGLKKKKPEVHDEAEDLGRQMANGMIRGLKGMEGRVANQAREMARSILESMKQEMKVKSPSRITEWIGRMVGQGFIDGMEGMLRAIQLMGIRIADAATVAASAEVSTYVRPFVATPNAGVIGGGRPPTPPANPPSPTYVPEVRVFVGDRELTDIVRVEVGETLNPLQTLVRQGVI